MLPNVFLVLYFSASFCGCAPFWYLLLTSQRGMIGSDCHWSVCTLLFPTLLHWVGGSHARQVTLAPLPGCLWQIPGPYQFSQYGQISWHNSRLFRAGGLWACQAARGFWTTHPCSKCRLFSDYSRGFYPCSASPCCLWNERLHGLPLCP